MKYLIARVSLAAALLASTSVASAQFHLGGGHHHRHDHVPIHHGSHFGHKNWNYVVPHRGSYAGAYYTVDNTHYYTPSHITQITPGGAPVGRGVVVEPQRPVELTFGGFSRHEDLAGRLALEANALCLDMHYNYRHNRNFAEVYREAYGVLLAAKYPWQGTSRRPRGRPQAVGGR
jgi:hypothetical protein